MKAIVTAAGLGSRLEHHTAERPKCMVEVAGRSILGHQLDALAANGISEIHIVRGYLGDRIVAPGATFHENHDFRRNNILLSLFCAESAMEGPFLSSYADILYGPEVVRAVLDAPGDIVLVVDTQWARAYEGRKDHPVTQAELTEVEGGRVRRVGKQVGPESALGEFIGLARYSAEGSRLLRGVFAEVRNAYAGREDEPFQAAPAFRKAYLTDLFLEMIARDVPVHCVAIHGGWREIDTVEDLERVRREWA